MPFKDLIHGLANNKDNQDVDAVFKQYHNKVNANQASQNINHQDPYYNSNQQYTSQKKRYVGNPSICLVID